MSNMNVSLANASVIVKLNITAWSANSRDKKASDEVAAENNVMRTGAARVYKSLLPASQNLKSINHLDRAARSTHYKLTAPWSDNGDRILPITLLDKYIAEMDAVRAEYQSAVKAFLTEYETDKTKAAFELGELYKEADYPQTSVIAQKFSFAYCIEPVPTANDFRVQLPEQMGELLKASYERAATSRVESAMRDVWDRVHKTLEHLKERLTDDGSKPNVFRNTLLENAKELTGLLSHLNVTKDPALEHARCVLDKQLMHIDCDDLRSDGALRAHVVKEVSNLMATFDALSMMSDVDAAA